MGRGEAIVDRKGTTFSTDANICTIMVLDVIKRKTIRNQNFL